MKEPVSQISGFWGGVFWNAFSEEGQVEESVVEGSPAAVFGCRIISFSSFQASPMLHCVSFLLDFTFPLLHMNRFDGTFASFIQPILVFLRIKVDEECFQWCKSMPLRRIGRSIPISIQIGVINWLISQLQDLFIVPDAHQNEKIGLVYEKKHLHLKLHKVFIGWVYELKQAETP